MQSVIFVSNPSEIGAGTRGSSLGFDALRIAGWKHGNDLLKRYPINHIAHNNAALYEPDLNPFAHRIAAITRSFKDTAKVLDPIFAAGQFPVLIGGDHSVAAGTISAVRKAFPDKRLGVVWMDAHADMHTPYTTPSGNFHGMPLAIALGLDNLECRKNDPVPQTISEWNAVKELWGICPKVNPEDLVFFGVRSTEEEEDEIMARYGMPNITVDDFRANGLQWSIDQACSRLTACDIVYISFDVDSMDPAHTSNGTGTPVDNGFTPEESKQIITQLFERLNVVCFEMVEINPTLDELGNAMAETAHGILEHVVGCIEHLP
ncbi:MAG: arginase [Flavobacteriales bacterium]|jgi:arginase